MERFFEKLKKVRLSKAEKEVMKRELLSKIGKDPFVFSPYSIKTYSELRLEKWPVLVTVKKYSSIFAVLLIIVTGFGTYVSAKNSLPGDFLYPLKVGMIEPLEGSLALSVSDKASWQSELANTRLAELEKLANEGKLDPVVSAELSQQVIKNANEFQNQISNIKSADSSAVAAGLSLQFESSLRAHQSIISDLDGKLVQNFSSAAPVALSATAGSVASTSVPTNPIVTSLRQATKGVEKIRVREENNLRKQSNNNLQSAAQSRLQTVNADFAGLSSLVSQNPNNAASSTIENIMNDLSAASTTIASGAAKMADGNYLSAYGDFQNADQMIKGDEVLLNAPVLASKQPPVAAPMLMQAQNDKKDGSFNKNRISQAQSGRWNYVFGSSTPDIGTDASLDSSSNSGLNQAPTITNQLRSTKNNRRIRTPSSEVPEMRGNRQDPNSTDSDTQDSDPSED